MATSFVALTGREDFGIWHRKISYPFQDWSILIGLFLPKTKLMLNFFIDIIVKCLSSLRKLRIKMLTSYKSFIPSTAECRPQFVFTWRDIQYTWNRVTQGWKQSHRICLGLFQNALGKGENTCNTLITSCRQHSRGSFKEEKTIQIILKAVFFIKQNKVNRPPQEIQFLEEKL